MPNECITTGKIKSDCLNCEGSVAFGILKQLAAQRDFFIYYFNPAKDGLGLGL